MQIISKNLDVQIVILKRVKVKNKIDLIIKRITIIRMAQIMETLTSSEKMQKSKINMFKK